MQKLHNKGFTVVEVLLLVVLVALVAGIGYYIYTQSQKQDETSKPQSSAQQSIKKYKTTDCETKDGMNGQRLANQGIFSMCVLNGWEATIDLEQNELVVSEPGAYDKEQAAVVNVEVIGGKDGLGNGLTVFLSSNDNLGWAEDDATKTDFKLGNGKTGTRYFTEYGPQTGEGIGPTEGDMVYEYVFSVGGGSYVHAAYTIPKGDKDEVETVEAALKTLEFYQ